MIDEKKLIAEIEAYAKDKTAKGCWYDRLWGLRMAIEIISRQPKVREWIPCSERLPEDPFIDRRNNLQRWIERYGLLHERILAQLNNRICY